MIACAERCARRSGSHQFGSSCAPLATKPAAAASRRPHPAHPPNPARHPASGTIRRVGLVILVRRGRRCVRRCIRRIRRCVRARVGVDCGRHLRIRARQGQLHAQILEFLELRQRRQVIEFLQAEIIEKFAGRAEQFRLARHVAVADHADPAALEQRLDDVGIDGHAADLFDFAARDRLAIGDQRQGFEQRPRILGRPLLPQPRHGLRHARPDLNAIAARHLEQFQAARLVVRRQRRDARRGLPRRSTRRARRIRSPARPCVSGRPAASSAASITFFTY